MIIIFIVVIIIIIIILKLMTTTNKVTGVTQYSDRGRTTVWRRSNMCDLIYVAIVQLGDRNER